LSDADRRVLAADDRVRLRASGEADIAFVMAAERDPENSPYIGQWTFEQHRAAIADPDFAHLIFEPAGEPRAVGFAIVAGRKNPDACVELRRIAVQEKGRGFGRAALRRIKGLAFDTWDAHRLWLDVRQGNARAHGLYLSEGFVEEGLLRECIRNGDRFESLIIMSILDREYRSRSEGGR
jgi:RimJ/RimL family protein N-acetyltransferase